MNTKKKFIAQKDSSFDTIEDKFFASVKYFLLICQCFCAAPIHLTLYANQKCSSKKLSIRNVALSIVHFGWSSIVLGAIITSTYFQYSEFDSDNLPFMTRILYFSEYISGIFNTTLIILGCYYQRHRYTLYFEAFIKNYTILISSGSKCDFEKIREFLKRVLIAYLIFFSCVIITDFMYNRLVAKSFFRSSTVYSIPNIISVLALTQYILLLHLLCNCYTKICDILTQLPDKYNQQWATEFSSRTFICESRNSIRSKNDDFARIGLNCEIILEDLRLLCLDLTKINKFINSSFGLLVISTIISTFVILSIQFYSFYTISEGYQEHDFWLSIYTALWIVLHGGKTFLILLFNHFVNEKVREF